MSKHFHFAAALLVLAAPVAANPSRAVFYGDLDLSSEQGKNLFAKRLEAAVRRACQSGEGWYAKDVRVLERCRRETTAWLQPRLAVAVARSQARRNEERVAGR